jgi:hypothetical protein
MINPVELETRLLSKRRRSDALRLVPTAAPNIIKRDNSPSRVLLFRELATHHGDDAP